MNNSAYHTLFSSDKFNTYLITAFSARGKYGASQASEHHWAERGSNIPSDTQNSFFTDMEAQQEQDEFEELGAYLLSQYPTKTFILLNWEGDSALIDIVDAKTMGAYVHSDAEALEMYDANVKWINARAEGVRRARINYTGGGTPKLYSGYEYKLLNRDDTKSTDTERYGVTAPLCGSQGGARWNRCAIDYIAPRVKVDYFSYSSYATVNRVLFEPNNKHSLTHLLREDLKFALSKINARVSDSNVYGTQNLILGEYGFSRVYAGNEVRQGARYTGKWLPLSKFTKESFDAIDASGVSYAVFWKLLDSLEPPNPYDPGYYYYGQFTTTNGVVSRTATGEAFSNSSNTNGETIWVDDDPLPGNTEKRVYTESAPENWNTISIAKPLSGNQAFQSNIVSSDPDVSVNKHMLYFEGTSQTLSVNTGDTLFAYVYLDPQNPPSEVMFQWKDGTDPANWNHRAYWGPEQELTLWGTLGTQGMRRIGQLPELGKWVRLEVPASLVGLESKTLNGFAFTLVGGRGAFDRVGKIAAKDVVWVEDSLPTGAITGSEYGDSFNNWVTSNPAPYSGTSSHQSNIWNDQHQHYFYGATQTLKVNAGDALYTYVYLDPQNPPSEVMLQWNDGNTGDGSGGWQHRAYWGNNDITYWGTDGTPSRR